MEQSIEEGKSGMTTTKPVISLMALLFLVGCASNDVAWDHPTNEQSTLYADEGECQLLKQQVEMQAQRQQQMQNQAQSDDPYSNSGAAVGTLIGKGLAAAFGGPGPAETAYRNCMKSKGYVISEEG